MILKLQDVSDFYKTIIREQIRKSIFIRYEFVP